MKHFLVLGALSQRMSSASTPLTPRRRMWERVPPDLCLARLHRVPAVPWHTAMLAAGQLDAVPRRCNSRGVFWRACVDAALCRSLLPSACGPGECQTASAVCAPKGCTKLHQSLSKSGLCALLSMKLAVCRLCGCNHRCFVVAMARGQGCIVEGAFWTARDGSVLLTAQLAADESADLCLASSAHTD